MTSGIAAASACAVLGVGLLRWSWGRVGRQPLLTTLGWLVLALAIPAWQGAGAAADKAVALAILLPCLMALALVAAQGEWLSDSRLARRRRHRVHDRVQQLETSGPRWLSRAGLVRALLAGPMALAVALGLCVWVALRAPASAADRLITAGLVLPLAWALCALLGLMIKRATPRLVANSLSAHSALGLALGALIYLICLTGTLSVLEDELKLLEQRSPAAVSLQPGQINASITAALQRVPGITTLYVLAPTTPRQRLAITAYAADGRHAFVAGPTGLLVPQHTPFTDFVVNLHTSLTAPQPWGSLLVGLGGAALLALLISGVVAHPRIFRDAFRLRVNGARRLREAELHNRLSVWGLPFHFAVTLSGALFGLANLTILVVAATGFQGDTSKAIAPLDGPRIAADPKPSPLPDLDRLLRQAQSLLPDSHLVYAGIERPGTQGMRIVLELGHASRLPRGEDFYFDAQGRPIGRVRYDTGSTGLQVYSGAAQVHFGFFGGLPVRLAYVALGAALTYITATGLNIWFERQADRGRPQPRLRRAWRAWTCGVPIALLIAALTSAVLPVGWTFLGVVLAAQAIALRWALGGKHLA